MDFVFFSDSHGKHGEIDLPSGDVLAFCGDMSSRGGMAEVESFAHFLSAQPHPFKVVIAGNHDFAFDNELRQEAKRLIGASGATYLDDSGAVIEGIRIWGSPIQPWFYDWAFNRKRGEEIRRHWDLIPSDTDVLLTHGPPHGILDEVYSGEKVGCQDLLQTVQRIRPLIHAFGHIHEAYGQLEEDGTRFINACSLDLQYVYRNAPVVVSISDGQLSPFRARS